MTPRGRKYLLRSLAVVIAAVALGGCISPIPTASGRYTAPIGGSPVISNETPYSSALRCLSRYTANRPLRVAVGQIADYTGKVEADNSGRKLTQGAALMAMSALSKAGVPLVERFDTSVAEMELKYANNKLIGDDKPEGPGDFRKIMAGSITGSNYYLVGGITELNFNIRSEGANADGGGTATNAIKGTVGGSMYVMNVGLDLRLVDTDHTRSRRRNLLPEADHRTADFRRRIRFSGADLFRRERRRKCAGTHSAGGALRDQRATLEMMSRLYRAPQTACAAGLGTDSDPLADATDRRPIPEPAQPKPTAMNEEKNNDTSRQEPYRWYSDGDTAADSGLRGQLQ